MATSAERLQQYEELFNQSQAYDPAQFQKEFEKSYGEITNYNQDLINQQSSALGELQSVAPELRQRYSQTLIKDPTLQRSLIAQARQAPITDYSNAVNLLGERGQRYSDILSTALSGYESAASRAQTAAENAWRLYQDQLAQEQAARASSSSSSSSLSDLLNALYGQDTQQEELDITVPDTTKSKSSWTDTLANSKWIGDYSQKDNNSTTLQKLSQAINPLTYVKTGAGLLGNYLGNQDQSNMGFWDKLFNRNK